SAIVTVSAISFTTIREERNLALDAEADAEREAAISKAANEFLNEYILASADPFKLPKKRDLTLLQVLDRAASTVEERFGAQPEVKAEIQLTLSQTYAELGAFDEAD